MLSDLIQYFTKTDIQDDEEGCDLTEYLEYIYQNTKDEELKHRIEDAVIYRKGNFYEVFENGFHEAMFLNDSHLSDALDVNYDNTLLTTLFSTIMPTSCFDIAFEDIEISWMLSDSEEERYSLNDYDPYLIGRKVDAFVNRFILNELKSYADDENFIDEYAVMSMRAIISHIKLKNKSYGRKLRKAYIKNEVVRNMFDELGFSLCNGEFVMVIMYDVESAGYQFYFDMDEIYNSLDILRKRYFKDDSKLKDNPKFLKNLKRLYQVLNDYSHMSWCHERLFKKIMKIHSCSKQEVIL